MNTPKQEDPLNVTTTTAASAHPNNDLIEVSILDSHIEYQLDPDDVRNVLEQFTTVHAVTVDPASPSRARVLVNEGTGIEVSQALDGQQLQGIDGVLSATCIIPQYQALIDLLLDQGSPVRMLPSSTPCRPAAPSPDLSPTDIPAHLDETSLKYLLELCGEPWRDGGGEYPFLPAGFATPQSLSEFEMGTPSPYATPASYNQTVAFSPWMHETPQSLRMPSPMHEESFTGVSPPFRPKTRKWTARYDIQINPDESFQVTRRIIGTRGSNMKRINQLTGAKLRLRGQGSGYLEGSSRQEAEDPLHLCISCCDGSKYKLARQMTEGLLKDIYADYDLWVSEQGGVPPRLHIRIRELYLPTRGSRDDEAASSSSRIPLSSRRR